MKIYLKRNVFKIWNIKYSNGSQVFESPNAGIILDLNGTRLINFKSSKKKRKKRKGRRKKKEKEEEG